MLHCFLPVLFRRHWGADHLGLISTKIGSVKRAHDIIILSSFDFNIFRGFRSTGGQDLSIDFAGHRYNNAAAALQPVMTESVIFVLVIQDSCTPIF